jgi:hypothetical protein
MRSTIAASRSSLLLAVVCTLNFVVALPSLQAPSKCNVSPLLAVVGNGWKDADLYCNSHFALLWMRFPFLRKTMKYRVIRRTGHMVHEYGLQ